jgi:hypothetical protein
MPRLLPILLAVVALVGCGGAPVARVTSPFSTSDATVFDQGVDFIDDPSILDGHWQDDWNRDFQHRIGSADLVELVHIVSLRTVTQPDEEPQYTIDVDPQRALLGDALDVDLVSRTSDTGYSGIDSNQRRLASGAFLVFVKFARSQDGTIVAKWHLSPASDAITTRAQTLIDARLHPVQPGQDQGSVTEHTN